MNRNNLILYALIFLSTFLFLETLQKDKVADPVLASGDIGMETQKDSYGIGKDIKVQLLNNTEEVITIESRCPAPYFDVEKFSSEGFVKEEMDITERNCEKAENLVLEPHKKETVSLVQYSYELFSEPGRYKISLTTTTDGEEKTFSTPEFEVHKPSLITEAWRTVLYQPTLNLLVGLLVYMPSHNLALAIIALTLIIRTILLVPSQRAIVAQRKMQEVQPKIEELKKKYANDQTRLAQETMLL
ncbi:MAG: YidC/Oxa1 family membrane protein insertase, partial [Patescibacteria group bacterium]